MSWVSLFFKVTKSTSLPSRPPVLAHLFLLRLPTSRVCAQSYLICLVLDPARRSCICTSRLSARLSADSLSAFVSANPTNAAPQIFLLIAYWKSTIHYSKLNVGIHEYFNVFCILPTEFSLRCFPSSFPRSALSIELASSVSRSNTCSSEAEPDFANNRFSFRLSFRC